VAVARLDAAKRNFQNCVRLDFVAAPALPNYFAEKVLAAGQQPRLLQLAAVRADA